jgi:hypothetical protein
MKARSATSLIRPALLFWAVSSGSRSSSSTRRRAALAAPTATKTDMAREILRATARWRITLTYVAIVVAVAVAIKVMG